MINPKRIVAAKRPRIVLTDVDGVVNVAGHRSGGFTLLEVMVAMLLLAVIMTTSVTMLFINLKGWESLTEHSDAVLEEHLIQKRITSMIQHLVPLVWRDQKQRVLALTGEARQLQFLSKAPQQHRAGGLFEYLLVQENAYEQGISLVLYFTPLDPNASQLTLPGNGSRRVLMSGLEEVEFSYFGSKQERETAGWFDSWEAGSTRYPDLIRLSLRYPGDEDGTQEHYFRIHQKYPMIVQRQ
ncbi:MAG: prepilin-type N-terminal cleavage/methylation domain-containing protein [Candidatus Thiodiazotropha endolucinida]